MDVGRLIGTVRLFGGTTGIYKGAYQVPFHLGLMDALHSLGYSWGGAFLLTALVAGVPRVASPALEILAGWLAQRWGRVGSFRVLPIGLALRGTALVGFGLVVSSRVIGAFSSLEAILILASVSYLVGELGRSLLSGAFEDAYQRSAEHLVQGDEAASALVGSCDVENSNLSRVSKAVAAFAGAALVGSAVAAKGSLTVGQWSQLASVAYFGLCVAAHLSAVFVSIRWARWARVSLLNLRRNDDSREPLGPQILLFLRNGDWLWSIAFGALTWQLFVGVNLAALQIFVSHGDGGGSLDIALLLSIGALAAIPSIGLRLGNRYFEFGSKAGVSRVERLKWLDGPRGLGIAFAWACAVIVGWLGCQKAPVLATVPVVLLLAIVAGPIFTWGNWMRVPLLKRAKAACEPPVIGESSAFYFSLLAGVREVGIAVASGISPWLSSFGIDEKFSTVLAAPIVLAITLPTWHLWRTCYSRDDGISSP